ncbi:MAG: flavocytochrome c [Pseudobutyrivibrio sp.]|nr:flavocytochrome c [Pseudobutyrivibrio sp.]
MEKYKGLISLILVIVLMFVVVFGVRTVSQNKPAESSDTAGVSVGVGGDNVNLSGVKDGVYTGEAQGFGGSVVATVTISGGKITDIQVTGDSETEGLGSVAVEKIPAKVLASNSLQVDAVSGATISSNAVLDAITAALASAGLTPDMLSGDGASASSVEKKNEVVEADIVVIGGGGAGMSSAITAKQAGADVILIEKMPYLGGNTTKATGGMNAAETHYQAEQGIEDTIDQFVEDTMVGGKEINNIDLVRTMAENSSDAIDWLDELGAPLPKVSFSGGATNARIHSPEDGSGVGEYLVKAFSDKLDEMQIPVYLDTKATELIVEDGKVTGVIAESEDCNYTFKAKAVILATGGFGANEEMYCTYRPDLKGTVTTNAPGATGDGIVMAQSLGADLVDIEQIQLHPTVEQATSMLITEGVRGDGAILVNQSGKRFINEMKTRDVVSAAELEQEGQYAYVIFDQNLRDGLKAIEKYVKNNIVVEAATIEELAKQIDMDPATLSETLKTWNEAVANQNDEEFGRDTGMEHDLSVAPYYAIKVAPGIHHTMGGIKIDVKSQVIKTDGTVIPGLFAAGEVCGGIHGANRIGGNAVVDIVVFGRIAAESAWDYIQ